MIWPYRPSCCQSGTEGQDGGAGLTVNKVNWAKVGRVAEPGRYMFKFGWVTITEEELAVWQQFPNASFTLYRPPAAETEDAFG